MRPLLPVDLGRLSEREIFVRAVLQKGTFWRYEDEFRFLRLPGPGDWHPLPIYFEGQHAHFPAAFLSGITLGARMPPAESQALIRIARNHKPQLPVWRAVETDTFDFAFESVAS